MIKNIAILVLTFITACTSVTSDQMDNLSEVSHEDTAVPKTASLNLPKWPWWKNQGLSIDKDRIKDMAGYWCTKTCGEGGAADFFFRWMPLQSVAEICKPGITTSEIKEILGKIYLSGWYGGLWFRDNSSLGDKHKGEPSPVSKEDFFKIVDNAVMLEDLFTKGTPEAVFEHNLEALEGPKEGDTLDKMMGALLILYAYNSGYVKAILENPPEGVDPSKYSQPCKQYLDCDFDGTPLVVYESLRSALQRIENPPNERWKLIARKVKSTKKWEGIGQALWESGSVNAQQWDILVKINDAYLKITDVAVLGSMLGYGDEDLKNGRCALLLEAVVDTWNRAYFLAIGSDAPQGVMPSIECR